MMSILRFVVFCQQNGIELSIQVIDFDSLICRARNAAMAMFMSDPSYSHVLFVDSDIEFMPDDVMKLLKANKSVICGAYAKKYLRPDRLKEGLPMHLCTDPSVHIDPSADLRNEIIPCIYVTTGFLLVKREVVAAVMKAHPERKFINDIDGYSHANSECFYDLFPVEINAATKRYESEDYGFSRLVRGQGIEIFCYTNLTLTHHGHMGFPTNFWQILRQSI